MKKGVAKKATKSVKKKVVATSSKISKSTVKKATKKKVSKKKKPARSDDRESGCSGSLNPVQSVTVALNITPPTNSIVSNSALGVRIGTYQSIDKSISIALQGTVPAGITIGSFGFRVTEETTLQGGQDVFVAEYDFSFTQLTSTTGKLTLLSNPQIPTDLKVTILTKKKVR